LQRLRRLPKLSIRSRIALAIFGASAIALVMMSLAVYLAFERGLRASLDDNLRDRSASYAPLVDTSVRPATLRLAVDTRQERAKGEALVRLYDTSGQLLHDASPAAGTSPEEAVLARRAEARSGEAMSNFSYSDGERFRVLAVPVYNSSEAVAAVLVTGLEQSQVGEPLGILRFILLLAVPSTSLALAFGSFVIVRRALRPVVSITASAERIAAGDLRERIEGVEPHDEIGELGRTFNHMIERLEETVERERRFTADAAHELRTPLAAMETSVDVTLGQQRSANEYRRALETVRGQTQRLDRLTSQLLLLSRLDAETLQTNFETVDLARLVRTVASSFADAHPEATVSLSGSDEALVMRGNSELLARAFGNVLDNAVIHGSQTATISISMQRLGDQARVVIADDGPGIGSLPAEVAFHRFRRGDAARSVGGSGLGLAIVDSIVHVHGGRVRLVPADQGTVVEFSLPLGT
jgi:heavy metal sensor kinase